MSCFDLVLQGVSLPSVLIEGVQAVCASTPREVKGLAHRVLRFNDVDGAVKHTVEALCAPHAVDHAFVPRGFCFASIGLIAMDMDSTLINIECIDEIADFAGKKDEIAAITESAMRGEIDWPQSLQRRVAALAGLDEDVLRRVYDERLELNPGARELIAAAQQHGIKTLLVSGGFTYFTGRIGAELGFDEAYSCTLEIIDGTLTGRTLGPLCDAQAKAEHLKSTALALSIPLEKTLSIGDGANDLVMMAAAGFSVAYHAKPSVRAAARCALNHLGLDAVVGLLS
jgi:phosphoserine phosphatase